MLSDESEIRAIRAEGLLGFVLLALGKDVIIRKELVEHGFPQGKEIGVEPHEDRLVIGLRDVIE